MSGLVTAYIALAFAISFEVAGSSFLLKSEQFTRLWPTVTMAVCYVVSFYALSQALKVLPLGVAYAIWAGLGIVVTAIVSVVVFRQAVDLAALIGIGFIVTGVVIMNVFSKSVGH